MDENGRVRKIIHVDMDAFYASVEQRNRPELKGKPVVVGGPPNSRGVVSTCSYEARKFGIHSAMPSSQALRLCPQAIFLKPDFTEYQSVSRQIQEIFRRFTDLIEPLSLDEAYLDVTKNKVGEISATRIAQEIRRLIDLETELTASAGVSYNKSLAKIASDWEKPNGLTVIEPHQAESFLETLPVRKFWGVGPVTAQRMETLGIKTGKDLKSWPLWRLVESFGKAGPWYYEICRGIDHRPVSTDRSRKSLGKERTFQKDLQNLNEIKETLSQIAEKVWDEADDNGFHGKTVTVKVKYSDFRCATRSRSHVRPIEGKARFLEFCLSLLEETEAGNTPVRLLGASLSGCPDSNETQEIGQLSLGFGVD